MNFGDVFIQDTHVPHETWSDVHVYLFHVSDAMLEKIEKGLNENFKKYWNPAKRVAIDESIRKFKGKWKGKVYIKNKPTKWRLKYYLMVDSLYYYSWFKLYKGVDKEDLIVK